MSEPKLAPGFKKYILSEREAAFICRILNVYSSTGDNKHRTMVDKITRTLNGEEE